MSYAAILTYHADVGTFRGSRGAWRVWNCANYPREIPPFRGVIYGGDRQTPALFMDVARPLRRGTWVNPTKLLRELIAKRRQSSTT